MTGPRYARRTDENHAEIRDQLGDVPGVYVQDVAALPGLGFDLLCNYLGGPPVFLEIKRPKNAEPLTASERRARDHWGAYWHRVTTLAEALAALAVPLESQP